MGLRDFLKKAEVDEEKSGWHTGNEDEEGLHIDVGDAFKAIKELKKRKS